MSLYNPEGIPPVVANTLVRVTRALDYPGDVLARVGARVEPEDIIARTYQPAAPVIINIAQELAVPAASIERALRREVGTKIEQGEEVARRLGGRSYLAPISGIIANADPETGYITITPEPEEVQLVASIRGVVMEEIPYRGVVIETPATQVYGAFGFGSERNGVLRLLVTDATEELTPTMIDARSAYAVLIGGASISAAALRRAVQEQVRGIIVGSVEERELRAFFEDATITSWRTGQSSWQLPHHAHAADPGLTLVVTEGFGTMPMATPIFDLLSARDRQEVVIAGTTSLRQPAHRPRLILPLTRSSAGSIDPPRPQLQPGATVRLLDPAHLGQVATVRAVANLPRRIGYGVRTPAVEVVLPGEAPFWLPRTALDVLA